MRHGNTIEIDFHNAETLRISLAQHISYKFPNMFSFGSL